jgi:hypothetical protein
MPVLAKVTPMSSLWQFRPRQGYWGELKASRLLGQALCHLSQSPALFALVIFLTES